MDTQICHCGKAVFRNICLYGESRINLARTSHMTFINREVETDDSPLFEGKPQKLAGGHEIDEEVSDNIIEKGSRYLCILWKVVDESGCVLCPELQNPGENWKWRCTEFSSTTSRHSTVRGEQKEKA